MAMKTNARFMMWLPRELTRVSNRHWLSQTPRGSTSSRGLHPFAISEVASVRELDTDAEVSTCCRLRGRGGSRSSAALVRVLRARRTRQRPPDIHLGNREFTRI